MQNIKPWQIVLFVAAIAAVGVGVFMMTRGRGLDLSNAIVMVDVETGELFSFSIDGRRGVGVPNFNPDSGKLSLLPVVRDDSGVWHLGERSKSILPDLDVEATAVVNAETGEVNTVGNPRRIAQKAAPTP